MENLRSKIVHTKKLILPLSCHFIRLKLLHNKKMSSPASKCINATQKGVKMERDKNERNMC